MEVLEDRVVEGPQAHRDQRTLGDDDPGDHDTYGGFDFGDATLDFAGELLADGHEVVTCTHDLGHSLPPDAQDHVRAFFDDHGGPDAAPWSDDSGSIPAGCALYAP